MLSRRTKLASAVQEDTQLTRPRQCESSSIMVTCDVLPNPVFEGSEKRIELHFKPRDGASSWANLRELPRDTLDHLMTLASCEIVSKRSNGFVDAYVLSESSLFVYPHCWVLKTCGTTKLLNCLPVRCFAWPHYSGLMLRRGVAQPAGCHFSMERRGQDAGAVANSRRNRPAADGSQVLTRLLPLPCRAARRVPAVRQRGGAPPRRAWSPGPPWHCRRAWPQGQWQPAVACVRRE